MNSNWTPSDFNDLDDNMFPDNEKEDYDNATGDYLGAAHAAENLGDNPDKYYARASGSLQASESDVSSSSNNTKHNSDIIEHVKHVIDIENVINDICHKSSLFSKRKKTNNGYIKYRNKLDPKLSQKINEIKDYIYKIIKIIKSKYHLENNDIKVLMSVYEQCNRFCNELKKIDDGRKGEDRAYKYLKNNLIFPGYNKLIRDIYLPHDYHNQGHDHDSTQIDFIWINSKGIFLIENKNYGGNTRFTIGRDGCIKLKYYNGMEDKKIRIIRQIMLHDETIKGLLEHYRKYYCPNFYMPVYNIISFSSPYVENCNTKYKYNNKCLNDDYIYDHGRGKANLYLIPNNKTCEVSSGGLKYTVLPYREISRFIKYRLKHVKYHTALVKDFCRKELINDHNEYYDENDKCYPEGKYHTKLFINSSENVDYYYEKIKKLVDYLY